MKKISIILSVSLFVIQICFAQALPSLQTGWERIYINNVGSFDLPPTMEIQKGKYKESVDEIRKIKGLDASQVTAQPKGTNDFDKEGLEKYARVMLETIFGSVGDFEKLNFNIAEYSQADINELSSIFRQQTEQSFRGTGLKLIEWYLPKFEKVNGVSCFHFSYKRQLKDKPFVLVHVYAFPNNDRMHTFALSYRLSEADYWKSDFAIILKSFRITNIR